MFAPGYIQPQDQGSLGIPDATAAQIASASRMVDGQIGRPFGLLWSPGADGLPGWMTTKTPTKIVKAVDAIAPGDSITLHLAYGSFGQGDIGSAVVIDRRNPESAETCIITAATGNTITLASVRFAHDANATVEFGLTISEESAVHYGGMLRTASRPLARVLGVTGSYRTGRHDDWIGELLTIGRETTLWNSFPLGQCDVDESQGSLWMLAGEVRGGFSRARVNYIAGWSYDALPFAIKQATANIARNMIENEIPGNFTMAKAGNAAFERKAATFMDADTLALLMPYRNIRI